MLKDYHSPRAEYFFEGWGAGGQQAGLSIQCLFYQGVGS